MNWAVTVRDQMVQKMCEFEAAVSLQHAFLAARVTWRLTSTHIVPTSAAAPTSDLLEATLEMKNGWLEEA